MFGESKGYPRLPISDIAEVIAGGDKPKDNSETMSADYPYPVFANGTDEEGLQCFSKEYRVDKPAVTISARGTIGATFIRKPCFTPVVRLIAIIPKETIDVVYLKYAIDTIQISSTGSSQQQLTVPNIKKEMLTVPPLELQQQFADLIEQSDKSKLTIENSTNNQEEAECLQKLILKKWSARP